MNVYQKPLICIYDTIIDSPTDPNEMIWYMLEQQQVKELNSIPLLVEYLQNLADELSYSILTESYIIH